IARAINSVQPPRAFVVLEQRRSLAVVSFQAHSDFFFSVISSTSQIRLRMSVAFTIPMRRFEVNVVNLSAHRATSPARHPFFKQILWHVDQDCAESLLLPLS